MKPLDHKGSSKTHKFILYGYVTVLCSETHLTLLMKASTHLSETTFFKRSAMGK